MAEPIEKIIAQGRRVNVEAKVALERAAELIGPHRVVQLGC